MPIRRFILIVSIVVLLVSGCTLRMSPVPDQPPQTYEPPASSVPPTAAIPTPAATLTADQLWERRFELVNLQTVVVDIISMDQVCTHNVAPGPSICASGVLLGSRGRDNHPLPLYQNNQPIQCQGAVAQCRGFANGVTYQVIGTLKQKQFNSGKLLDSFYLDVTDFSAL